MANSTPPPEKTQTINLSLSTLSILCGAIAALGGGFLGFYQSVCVPQTQAFRDSAQRQESKFEKLQELIWQNSQAIKDLISKLTK